MVRGGLKKPEDTWLRLNHSPKRNIEEMLPVQKETLMDRFDSGETLYFRIPVSVREKRESTENISYFEAIVQKDESIDQGKDYYVRGNLAIQDIDTIKSYQARAFVHIKEDEPLAHLLRDTEEPSHSNWRTGAARAKAKYVNVDPTVRFVKNAVRDVLATLTKDKKEKVRENAFIDVFFVKKPKTSPGENGHKPTPPTPSPVIPPRPEPYLFQIGKISSGFTVSAQDGLDLPECINIQLAYECKGNPLSKYSSFDFQLDRSPILIEHENCSYEAERNCLEIKNICRGFKVVVTGFDVNRDLYIKAESIKQQEKGND